ncbi:MAG: NERD domain-containing protein [Clostridiales bacterium]|jgi:hypothetical protein|nr:NERD domain-containing protein [Clostridiales bacterium]
MAIMHPSQILDKYRAYSEVKFFNACKKQLSNEWHVYYSIKWYSIVNGRSEYGECDFLIFNPAHGFLCVEVKGGAGIEINKDGSWYLIENGDSKMKLDQSPYDQAERSMRFFYQRYEEETKLQFPGVYGHAAAYPNYSVSLKQSINFPAEITIDFSTMNKLQEQIINIFRYFSRIRYGVRQLPQDARKNFFKIMDKCNKLSIAAGALIQDKERELEEINRVQDIIVNSLTSHPRAFIIGGAGTGKTWIGIKKLRKCISDNNTALYLCFNKALARYVKNIVNDLHVKCIHMHGYMYELLGDQIRYAPTDENGIAKFGTLIAETYPPPKQYDLVVIDEGQDFTEDWAIGVNYLVKDNGSLYVLYDHDQNIFGRNFGENFVIDERPIELYHNLRNTSNICSFAKQLTKQGLQMIENQIEGINPDYKHTGNKANAVSYLDTAIGKLIKNGRVDPQKIIILSNRRKENSILNAADKLGGYKLSDLDPLPNNNYIAYRTIQGFKGLESDIVFYINHVYKDAQQTDKDRATLYTALTRARFYLFLLDFYL